MAIYGSRPDGHAKVLVATLATMEQFEVVGLVDDVPANRERHVRGHQVLGTSAELSRLDVDGVLLGFGEAGGRSAALERVLVAGLDAPPLVHPTALVFDGVAVGRGVQILAGAYVGPDVRLGDGALVNTHAVVEHDCRIDAGAVIAPGAVLTGRVQVGEGADIGAGAVVLPDCSIGRGAVVGAGAVVTRNVEPNTTVVGVPARALR